MSELSELLDTGVLRTIETYSRVNAEFIRKVRGLIWSRLGGKSVKVYYPGIGGGEEPIDLISPFVFLDADEVYGVDLFPYPGDGHLNRLAPENADINLAFKKMKQEFKENYSIDIEPMDLKESPETWHAQFTLDGRIRRIIVSKIPTDATITPPPEIYPVIYSKRTINVINKLPKEVTDNVQAVFFIGEHQYETVLVENYGRQNGFNVKTFDEFMGKTSSPSPLMTRLLIKI